MTNNRIIKFSIPTSFDSLLINKIDLFNNEAKNKVVELYGSMKENLTGSGRPSKILQNITLTDLEKHIEECHKNSIKFNYLLNGACIGAKEFEISYLKKIIAFVRKLEKLKIDVLTVTNPYLINVIKNKFPQIKICLSIIAGVTNLQEIKIYEKMGVERLVLDANINRDFKLLSSLKGKTSVELEVLANNPCLFKCPFRRYHPEIDSHISIKEKDIPSFPSIICKNIRLENLEEIIKSPWIRPLDVHYYIDLGIDHIKLSGRGKNTSWLLNMTEHYLNEDDGENFYQFVEKNGWEFFREKNKKLKKLEVSIPFLPINFLDFFQKKDSNYCGVYCDECGYCKKIAQKYIKINNKNIRKEYLAEIRSVVKEDTNPRI